MHVTEYDGGEGGNRSRVRYKHTNAVIHHSTTTAAQPRSKARVHLYKWHI